MQKKHELKVNKIETSKGDPVTLGVLHLERREFDKSFAYFEEAILAGNSFNLIIVGDWFRDLGQYEKARYFYEHSLEADSDNEGAFKIGEILFHLEKYGEATPYFTRCMTEMPEAEMWLGLIYILQQDNVTGLALLKEAANRGCEAAFFHLGFVNLMMKNNEMAQRCLNMAGAMGGIPYESLGGETVIANFTPTEEERLMPN